MSYQQNHHLQLTIGIDGTPREDDSVEHIFLVDQAGSDFTFYQRDKAEPDAERLCRILQQGGARADRKKPPDVVEGEDEDEATRRPLTETLSGQLKESPATPKQEYSFPCRINVLRSQFIKDDLVEVEKELVLLKNLRDAKDGRPPGPHYTALLSVLTVETRGDLDGEEHADKKPLDERVIEELNDLLARDISEELLEKTLTPYEQELVAQVKDDPGARMRLSNYLRFSSLFKDAVKSIESRIRRGRVLAALSYEGKYWSITFRKQETGSGYAPSKKIDGTLNSIEELCDVLYEEIFHVVSRSEATAHANVEGAEKLPEIGGLVVVAGSTNSAKSLITRGLIHLYLDEAIRNNPKRRPHLVTFEDPIEKNFIFEPGDTGDVGSLAEKIDYTPRQQGADAADLDDALHDALRQTPKVFFVGETRRREDWLRLIEFAATGHLVITTAHAGSLIEAMHKILLAAKAKTPADRNEIASRLLAVIQLKRAEVAGYENCDVLVPAVWRRVPRGVNSLTAEGLASILPHSHSDEKRPCSSLGRTYFAEVLLERAKARIPDSNFKKALTTRAIEWDLQGA